MIITRNLVAEKLGAYLNHTLSQAELVDWAEYAMMEAEFDAGDINALREVVSRIGLADVRAFGLSWEDCRRFLEQLGYAANVRIVSRS